MFSRYRYKQKSRHPFRWLVVLLVLIGVPVGLEFLTRFVTHATGISERFTADPTSDVRDAYQLQFVGKNGQPYEGLADEGQLMAVRDPLMGYQLAANQQSDFWQINENGFRDAEAVPLEKPAGEVRIFVLGGSTAFGQLSSDNQTTFANKLEARLNEQVAQQRANPGQFQPSVLPYRADQVQQALSLPSRIRDGQYRVINAAIPGYASGNELAMLMQRIATYNPDFVVVLDGYADLMLSSSEKGADIPGIEQVLAGEGQTFGAEITEQVQDWFNRLYIVRGVKYYGLQLQQSEPQLAEPLNLYTPTASAGWGDRLPIDQTELNQRVQRYGNHLQQMVNWASANQKRLIIGIEPEITSRQQSVMTPEESAIVAELGDAYVEQMRNGFTALAAVANQAGQRSANAEVLNLYPLYETFAGQAFQGPTSLTDEANTLLSDRLYEAIADELSLQPQPFGS